MKKNTVCLNCGTLLKNGQTKYCCRHCQLEYQYKQYIIEWKAGRATGAKGFQVSSHVRRYLLEKVGNKCQLCGWHEINPVTGKSPLEIHHIDGDYRNNSEENLQVLCPNCHSLTPTYKALNREEGSTREGRNEYFGRKNYCVDCGAPISSKSVRCKDCETKRRTVPEEEMKVSREELKNLIRTIPFVQIAAKYGVSDKAIVKWCVKLGLPSKKKDIREYTDEDWAMI